jgi:hypothetical protein
VTFHKTIEDPFYDDDGNCVDEDHIDPKEWDAAFPEQPSKKLEACYIMDCDPFSTINS